MDMHYRLYIAGRYMPSNGCKIIRKQQTMGYICKSIFSYIWRMLFRYDCRRLYR